MLFGILIGAVAEFIAVLPFLMAFQVMKYKQGSQGTVLHNAGIYLFAFFISGVFTVTGIPSIQHITVDFNVSLIPFAEISSNGIQYVQNAILFIPLGFLLPFLWTRYAKLRATVLCGFLFSLGIELMQLLNFRATDVDDLLMNTAGAAVGWCIFAGVKKVWPASGRICLLDAGGKFLAKWEPEICFGILWAAAFFIQGLISSALWGIALG